MSLTLDMTQQEFVQAMRTGDTREQTLHIIVVRLLAIALMVTDRRQPQDQPGFLTVPEGYRTWPVVESQLASRGRCQRLSFYVCPSAAILSDEQSFPVGTAFVVETYRTEAADEPLVSRFVMGKYSGVTTGESDCVQYGAWAYANFGPAGEMLPMDETSCGI
jgi:Cytochrome P460